MLSYLPSLDLPFPGPRLSAWVDVVKAESVECVRDTVHSMISATTQEVSSIFPPRPILSLVSAQNVAIFDRLLYGNTFWEACYDVRTH